MKVNKIIIIKVPKKPKNRKKKYHILYDQEITPPRTSDQILAALKQQYDVLSFIIENGTATAIVGKQNETE